MTATASKALTLALQLADFLEAADIDGAGVVIGNDVFTADDLKAEFERGLASLKQGPRVIDDIGVQSMIRSEIARHGSEAELARRMGITRQALHDVYSARKGPGPSVLHFLHLRKIGGRTRYEIVD